MRGKEENVVVRDDPHRQAIYLRHGAPKGLCPSYFGRASKSGNECRDKTCATYTKDITAIKITFARVE
jgi:hypothetical protein